MKWTVGVALLAFYGVDAVAGQAGGGAGDNGATAGLPDVLTGTCFTKDKNECRFTWSDGKYYYSPCKKKALTDYVLGTRQCRKMLNSCTVKIGRCQNPSEVPEAQCT
ncbi:hypothetical protein O9K51_00531 [Purpureocillium lavendulum]|uniref:Antifungal protein n=1 Tax=Purpureocillium lavendulum TaxID=1247861 RepID=A0AB34G273_9HYPO|nr:hypothetical protein O9K51_00531 [Purpureocillium lavendulum]